MSLESISDLLPMFEVLYVFFIGTEISQNSWDIYHVSYAQIGTF